MKNNIYLMRTAELRKKLLNCDSALITNIVNVRYLTGFTGSSGIFAVTPGGDHLIVDFRYIEQAKKETCFQITNRDAMLEERIDVWLRGGKRCIIEENDVSLNLWKRINKAARKKSIRLISNTNLVESLRLVKSDEEISKLRAAAELLSQLMKKTISIIRPGMRETDVAFYFETMVRKETGKPLPFDPIVASGFRSSLPHGIASNKIIKKNEFVVLDLGINLDGYIADMTRTVCTGKLSAKMKLIYDYVHLANVTASKSIKPGMKGSEAHSIASGVLDAKKLGRYFGHGLGHGLGMEVHENPRLSPRSSDILKPGMVFTIEPGVYIPGVGGVRIEDSGVLRENGFELFPAPERNLVIVH